MGYRRSVVPAVVRAKTDHQKTYRYGTLVDTKGKYLPVSCYGSIGLDNAHIVAGNKGLLFLRHLEFKDVPYIFSVYVFQS